MRFSRRGKTTGTPAPSTGASRAVGLSAVVRVLTLPLTATATFGTTALVIGYAGPSGFAAVMVIATLAQLVPYTDLGIGAGVMNAVSSAEPGTTDRQRAVASAVRVLLLSAVAVAAVAIAIALTVGWPGLLGLDQSGLDHLDEATLATIILIALSIPLGLGQRVLTALLRNPTVVALSALTPIVALGATYLVVVFGLPPALLALAPPIGSLISAFIATILATRAIDFRFSSVFRVRTFRYAGLLSTGIWFLLVSMSSAFTFQWGRVILANRTLLDVVADYSIVMQMYSPIWSVFIVSGTALWPIFSRLRSEGVSARRLRWRMSILFAGAGLVATAFLVLLGPWVASLLSRGTVVPELVVFAACGIQITVQAFQYVIGMFLTSKEGLRFQAFWGAPMAATVLIGVWMLAPTFGAATPFACAAISQLLFRVIPNVVRAQREDRDSAVAAN